jgi:hypothetical protein
MPALIGASGAVKDDVRRIGNLVDSVVLFIDQHQDEYIAEQDYVASDDAYLGELHR